jgi:hypothetical protein
MSKTTQGQSPRVEPPEDGLALFRLVPRAAPDDPRWLGHIPSDGVVVRARSAADARVVAAEAETDFLDIDAKPSHGVSTRFASAFRDELLYQAVEIAEGEFSRAGPREVVAGRIDSSVKPHRV